MFAVQLVWMYYGMLVEWLYRYSSSPIFLEGSVMAHISLIVQDENGICTQAELQVVAELYVQNQSWERM